MEEAVLKEKPKKKIWRIMLEWILYLAILAGLAFGTPRVLAKALHTPYPIASITSSSMWPTLKQGDIVFIKGINGPDEIKIGDIVVYKNDSSVLSSGQSFTIHRVVQLNVNTFVTKGDADNVEDSPTTYDKLIGKAVDWNGSSNPVRVPYLGTISQIFKR